MGVFSMVDATTSNIYWQEMSKDPLVEGVLIPRSAIAAQVDALAYCLNEEYRGKKVTVIPVMMGGDVFLH